MTHSVGHGCLQLLTIHESSYFVVAPSTFVLGSGSMCCAF